MSRMSDQVAMLFLQYYTVVNCQISAFSYSTAKMLVILYKFGVFD